MVRDCLLKDHRRRVSILEILDKPSMRSRMAQLNIRADDHLLTQTIVDGGFKRATAQPKDNALMKAKEMKSSSKLDYNLPEKAFKPAPNVEQLRKELAQKKNDYPVQPRV